jgi:hypothetical protein
MKHVSGATAYQLSILFQLPPFIVTLIYELWALPGYFQPQSFCSGEISIAPSASAEAMVLVATATTIYVLARLVGNIRAFRRRGQRRPIGWDLLALVPISALQIVAAFPYIHFCGA